MTLSLAAISGFYYISDPDVRLGLVASFSIAIFTFVYSLGAGPIPFTFSAEVFPLALRGRRPPTAWMAEVDNLAEVGMSFSVMVNFLGLGLLILFVPRLTQALGGGNACGLGHESSKRSLHKPCTGEGNLLFLFTSVDSRALGDWYADLFCRGLNVLAFILSFLFVPGTQNVSLEQMDFICMPPLPL